MNKFTDQEWQKFIEQDTFCIAPLLSYYVDASNDLRPCCISELKGVKVNDTPVNLYNHTNLKNLRHALANGIKDMSCDNCWKAEKVGMNSLRNALNGRYKAELPRLQTELNRDYSLDTLDIKYLDIRFNNKCNLKCRTCGPGFSSSWYNDYKELNPKFPVIKKISSNVEVKDITGILDSVTDIYFAGGEPLVTDEHYEVLDYLIKNNRTDVIISYNTNFSKLTYKDYNVLDYWKQFKAVNVAASLDGNHAKGEYIRKNLSWSNVLKNRKALLKLPHVNFTINCTVSVLNAYNVVELHREWVELGYISPNGYNINLLFGPDPYCIKDLPDNHKQALIALYNEQIEWLKTFEDCDKIIGGYNSAINLLNEPRNVARWQGEWRRVMDGLDKIRNEDFYTTFPEYKDLK